MPYLSTLPNSEPNTGALQRGLRGPLYPGAALSGASEQPSQLVEYWEILRSNFKWICALTLIGGALGWMITVLSPSIYRARTVLDIRSLNEDVLNPKGGLGNNDGVMPESYLQTEIKILQSDSLLKRALDRVRAGKQPLQASTREMIADAGSRIKVRAMGNTRMVEILCDARDAQLAADVCNSISKTYSDYNVESHYRSTKEMGMWLQSQLDDVRKRLTKAEADLTEAASGSAFLFESETEGGLIQERLRQLQTELSRSQAERITKQSAYEIAAASSADSLETDAGPLRDYRLRLSDLQRQLAEASSTMTPEHYKVRELKMQVAEVQRELGKEHSDLLGRLRADSEAAKRRESMLTTAYDTEIRRVADHGGNTVRYNMLKHDVDTERQLYQNLLQKVEEVGLATAMRTSTVSVVDAALPAPKPYSPSGPVDIGIGLFAGACIGFMVSFIRLRSDRTLKGPGEAPLHLQLRELGVIPSVRRGSLSLLLKRERPERQLLLPAPADSPFDGESPRLPAKRKLGEPIALATWHRDHPEVAEAFSGTMNSLLFANRNGERARVIVMTSPEAGDGKTTVSVNLAIALAQIGRRVVLVDGDLRKPRLHRIFETEPECGLAGLLDQEEPPSAELISDCVEETEIANLFVLPTNPAHGEISAKLHSGHMRNILTHLRREFDIVLIDSPPMLHISDARVLGWLADGVLLVFRARKTTREAALATYDCLLQDGISVIGTILNDWQPGKDAKYGAYASYMRAAS